MSGSNVAADAVEVDFDQLSSYVAVFGNELAQGGFFGISFKALCSTVTPCTAGTSVGNPNNNPPTSVSSTRYYDLSVPAILFLDNFPYTDIDGNAFRSLQITSLPSTGTLEYFNGSAWVSATVGTVITAADVQLGYLRYTGTGSSFGYKVNDGLVDSVSAYTLTLVGAANGQVITFVNPGNKTPTAPNFASNATADSGLTVVLTSLTPSICAVVGLNIDPLAVGACTIVASQPGNSSYGAATNVTQTFYITTDAAQTITLANPGDQTWTGSSFTIPRTPTATSGLTVTLTSFSPSVCTISGTTITIVGQGTCQIRATQGGGVSGGTTYAAAPPVTISFVVATASAPSTFNITYDTNTSTGGSAPATQNGTGSVTLSTNSGTLVKTGYSFTGWNTLANGNGTHYNVSASYNLSADVTLYAQWTIVNYTVTYNTNGATSGSAPSPTVGSGSVTLATNSGSLLRTHFNFLGWNTSANGSGTHYDAADPYTLNANVTLYAEWVEVLAITYVGNGNTGGSVGSATTGTDGSTVILDNNTGTLVRTGYRFDGWNTLANGSGTSYEEGTNYHLTGNVTLYAKWVALNYTITFDGNTNTGGTVPSVVTGYGSKTLHTNTGSLTLTNFTFKGWNTQADGLGTHYNVGAAYNLLADVTLYAEWVLTPAVIYNPNGATGGTAPGEIPANSPITIDPNTGNLIRAGFRFLGWNTLPNGGGTHYGAGMTPVLPVGTVLYAEWEPVDSLASTGSNYANEIAGASALIGFGLFINAIAAIRRRRTKA